MMKMRHQEELDLEVTDMEDHNHRKEDNLEEDSLYPVVLRLAEALMVDLRYETAVLAV